MTPGGQRLGQAPKIATARTDAAAVRSTRVRPAKGRLQSRRHGRTSSVSILANAALQRGHVKLRCSSVDALLQGRKRTSRKRIPEHAAGARNRARDSRAGAAGIAGIAEPSVNSVHHGPAASKPSSAPATRRGQRGSATGPTERSGPPRARRAPRARQLGTGERYAGSRRDQKMAPAKQRQNARRPPPAHAPPRQ